MVRVVRSMALKAPSFIGRKIEDFIRCEMGDFQLWIRNVGGKWT